MGGSRAGSREREREKDLMELQEYYETAVAIAKQAGEVRCN